MMTGTQIVAIVFIALFLIEAIDNFRLKKMLKEFLRENNDWKL